MNKKISKKRNKKKKIVTVLDDQWTFSKMFLNL